MSQNPPPAVSGARIKLRYMTQAKARPPSFVLFGTRIDALPESYMRYLVNGVREAFEMPGVPIRFTFRAPENPFKKKMEKKDARGRKEEESKMNCIRAASCAGDRASRTTVHCLDLDRLGSTPALAVAPGMFRLRA